MGTMQAMGMAEHAPSIDVALQWHFEHNHFPPLPTGLIPVAKQAIELASDGEWDVELDLDGEAIWRGLDSAPVWACVEGWHLEPWIEQEGEEFYDSE